MTTGWMDGSQLCASVGGEWWFPERVNGLWVNDAGTRAKDMCRRCPLIDPCLEYAVTHDVEGIWGGKSRASRLAIAAERGIDPIRSNYWQSFTAEAIRHRERRAAEQALLLLAVKEVDL